MKMTSPKLLTLLGLVGLGLIVALLLLTSPMSSQLFQPASNSDWLEDLVAFLVLVFMLFGMIALVVTSIIACCHLAKRLGYDLYAGLLLLIPGINVFVFFLWAFKESPNERKLLRLRR